MIETVVWFSPQDKMPKPDTTVLLALTDGSVSEGYWDTEEKAWMYGWDCAIYPEDTDLAVHHWAPMPKGPRWKAGTPCPHPTDFPKRRLPRRRGHVGRNLPTAVERDGEQP